MSYLDCIQYHYASLIQKIGTAEGKGTNEEEDSFCLFLSASHKTTSLPPPQNPLKEVIKNR